MSNIVFNICQNTNKCVNCQNTHCALECSRPGKDMFSFLATIAHPDLVPLHDDSLDIYLQQGGEKGGHMFLGVSTQGSD